MTRLIRRSRSNVALRFSSAGALALCLLAAAIAPACSSDSSRPSLVSEAGQPNEGGRSGSASDEAGSGDLAGASGDGAADSGAAGNAGESGATPVELGGSGGNPPIVPAVCDPLATWSAAASVTGVSSSANETLLALTPDELDLAFLRGGALFVAHRSTVAASFSSGSALAIPMGWSAAHGAALSADG